MAQLFSTGPAHIYLAFPNGAGQQQTPVYLGTCEDAPNLEIIPSYKDVFNDIGGELPFDKSYQGEVAMIDLDLNRYNEVVYATLAARPRVGAPGTLPRGNNAPGDVGSLILTEGLAIGVYILFPFGAAGVAPKLSYIGGGMPPGYRFPAGVPIGPDKLRIGSKPRKTHVLFFALRAWSPVTQIFTLYDHNVAGLPAIN